MDYKKNEVLQYVAENDVKFIKLFFTDIFGSLKSLTIQPSLLQKAFEEGVSFDGSSVRGLLNIEKSDFFLVPDPTTLSVLPWRPQHGRVARLYCDILYPDGTPFEGDSRLILQRVVEKAEKLGFNVNIGTECEFYLFNLNESGHPTNIPHDTAGYCDLAPLDKGENIRRDIILNLEQMGIEPLTSHHESGPGQNEIDFKHNTAIKAADNFATFKTTVKTIASKSGLFATFMPKPLDNEAGSGLHINISLIKNGDNIFEKDSPESKAFMAGILKRIREITAFLNPMRQSYKRLGSFEAPRYVSWSSQNRSQLIRVPAASGDSVRIELRSPDPSCNQYTALALIIAAGLEGIEQKLELCPPKDVDLFKASATDITGLESLPLSLDEALILASSSAFVRRYIPECALNSFVSVKTQENDPLFGEF